MTDSDQKRPRWVPYLIGFVAVAVVATIIAVSVHFTRPKASTTDTSSEPLPGDEAKSSCDVQLFNLQYPNDERNEEIDKLYLQDLAVYNADPLGFLSNRAAACGGGTSNFASLGRLILGEYEDIVKIIQSSQVRGAFLGRARLNMDRLPPNFFLALSDPGTDTEDGETGIHQILHDFVWFDTVGKAQARIDTDESTNAALDSYISRLTSKLQEAGMEDPAVTRSLSQEFVCRYMMKALFDLDIDDETVATLQMLWQTPGASIGAIMEPSDVDSEQYAGIAALLKNLSLMIQNSPALADYEPSDDNFNLSKEEWVDELIPVIGIAALNGGGNLVNNLFTEIPSDYAIDATNHLELADAVFEAGRIRAPVNNINIILQEPTTFNIGGESKTFPEGTVVAASIGLGSVDPKTFPNPDTYDHTRDNLMSQILNYNSVGFDPEELGTRVCPGRNIALKMGMDVLKAWLQRTSESSPGEDDSDVVPKTCKAVIDDDFQWSFDRSNFVGLPFHKTVPESASFSDRYNNNLLVMGAVPVLLNAVFIGECANQRAAADSGADAEECRVPLPLLEAKIEELIVRARDGGTSGIQSETIDDSKREALALMLQNKTLDEKLELIGLALEKNEGFVLNIPKVVAQAKGCGILENIGTLTESQLFNEFSKCFVGDSPDFGWNAPTKLSDFNSPNSDSFYQLFRPPQAVFDSFFEGPEDDVGVRWIKDDAMFGYMRLTGSNPDMIRRATPEDVGPDNFPVTDEMWQAAMGGDDTLEDAVVKGEAYILDFAALKEIEGVYDAGKILFSPKALFGVDDDGSLVAVAIQIYNDPSKDNNDIIVPPQGERSWADADQAKRVELLKWSLAKIAVNSAENSYYQLVTHLARTHLVMEPVIIAASRKLPEEHPVNQLLQPHFVGTLQRNEAAHDVLIAPDNTIDWNFPPAIETAQAVAVAAALAFSENVNDFFLPKTIAARNVEDLPEYPYRDDAMMHWEALSSFIRDYLNVAFADDAEVSNDPDLGCWAGEMATTGKMNNFGTDGNNEFESINDLADFLTLFIFTASAQHASTNYAQGVFSLFTPVAPLAGYVDPHDVTEENVEELSKVQGVPPHRWLAFDGNNILSILSSVHYNFIGQYVTEEGQDMLGEEYLPAIEKFRESLDEIRSEIDRKNSEGGTLRGDLLSYTILHPDNVPESIHI